MNKTRMRPVRGLAAAAAAVLAIVALGLAGCSAPSADAPAVTAAHEIEAELRASAAVTDVSVSVGPRDEKDHPDEYTVTVRASAVPGALLEAVTAMRDATARGVSPAELDDALLLPATDRTAPATLFTYSDDDADAALFLVALAGVESVAIASSSTTVNTDGRPLRETAADLRADSGYGVAGALAAVDVAPDDTTSVAIGRDGPSIELLDAIDRLRASGAVSSVRVSELATGGDGGVNPVLEATAADPAAVAAVLANTSDAGNTVPGRASTRFELSSSTAASRASGSVGSELPVTLAAAPPSTDVEATVRAFLDAAGSAVGVAAQITTETVTCSDGATTSIVGHGFYPVFTVLDSAQDAFDLIVEPWDAAGFRESDAAMGHKTFAPGHPAELGIRSATIWGTTDGLYVDASSPCA
jgi:hypothetical protein